MKRAYKFLLVILLFSMLCCFVGCQAIAVPLQPVWDLNCEITVGNNELTGNLTIDKENNSYNLVVLEPEVLSGMIVTLNPPIITVDFCGLTKTSDKYQVLQELLPSRVLTKLRYIADGEISYTPTGDGRYGYTSEDITIVAGEDAKPEFIKIGNMEISFKYEEIN